jgi:hypothetical protein
MAQGPRQKPSSQEPESRIQEKTNQNSLNLSCRLFEPQNIEQGISNIEVITSSFCGSLFCCSTCRHGPPEADSGEAGGYSVV